MTMVLMTIHLVLTSNLCSMVILIHFLGGKSKCAVTEVAINVTRKGNALESVQNVLERFSKLWDDIIGIDEELCDILEDGVGLTLDEEGVVLDRNKYIYAQQKVYKKHHKIRRILVVALPHKEYFKLGDKSTTKVIFKSLRLNYKGNQKVKEAKANMLVQ
ncbi:transmembrane protein, putative [Medicago truncatula]|uniref:Transmembrane protein, putative n=1 Tax=Medicago truncatula TaxID=3880 RepID=A0A072TSC8_MEDTR|nr:transmembrane protein, putative [Medicago truncatula]